MTASKISSSKKNILIIEDEGDICFLLNIILGDKKVKIEHVNTLSQAKVFMNEKAPSLVFLDNSLPDGRGTDFIEYIKMNFPQTKIIVITGYDSSTERERAKKNGADLYMVKPFTKEQIYIAVQELLEIDLHEHTETVTK
ncbi:MAG: response regulator [Bacteroidetes bacterium]|nr:response regulator [Bacteroidota bacterium]